LKILLEILYRNGPTSGPTAWQINDDDDDDDKLKVNSGSCWSYCNDIQGDSLDRGPKLLEKWIQVCLDVKWAHLRHRLWAGPVLHRSRCVYINF
jgi:hypothetical protein